MAEVIPAIIPESFEDLREKMSLVNELVPVVQVDVCDGKFVPSKSWPFVNDKGDFEQLIRESEGFPFWETLDFEADLMVANPEDGMAEDWIKAGAKRIILHEESSDKILKFVKKLRKEYGYFGDSAITMEIGIGINVDTPDEVLDVYLKTDELGRSLADFVQFMGIDKIGYQGQSFDERDFEKIRNLREKYPEAIISVDGGVNLENAPDLVEAGVNRLVSGSAIYESENIEEAIEEMKNI